MRVELWEIPNAPAGWDAVHDVRALAIDGDCQVLDELEEWKQSSQADYKKIVKVIGWVAKVDRVRDPNKVKRDSTGAPIYEMRERNCKARLFFFYAGDDEIIVCTNAYWKTKPSKREQEAAFKKARECRQIYLEWKGESP